MNNKSMLGIILLIVTLLTTLYYLNNDNIEQYTLYSQGGCCHINVTVKSTPETGTVYIIEYNDNIKGIQHTEVETREVDADYMIGMFQDHCMMNHQEE